MKDIFFPAVTPFSLSHSISTPDRLSLHGTHYFDSLHSDITPPNLSLNEISIELQTEIASLRLLSFFDFLPNEILSLVFEHVCLEGEGICTADIFRSSVSRVCRRWREIILNTPSLWSVVKISPGNISSVLDALPNCLLRSKDYPLDIHLNCFWSQTLTESVMEKLICHSSHWKNLSIISHNGDAFSTIHDISIPSLTALQLSHYSPQRNLSLRPPMFSNCNMSNLSHLSLRNVDLQNLTLPIRGLSTLEIRGYGVWPEYSELWNTLANSEKLLHLILHVKPADVLRDVHRQDRPPIPLPKLRKMDIVTSEWLSSEISTLASLFTFPSIETLTVKESYEGPDILHLSNSLHPERGSSLYAQSCNIHIASTLLPPFVSLTRLELHSIVWPNHHMTMEVFNSLPCLKEMVLMDLQPTLELHHIKPDEYPNFSIPSLRILKIEFKQGIDGEPDMDAARFIRLFSLRSLETLALRNMTSAEWRHILASFEENVTEYPALCSLHVGSIVETLDSFPSPAAAFPHLRELSLIRVQSNAFMRHLLYTHTICQGIPISIWPGLNTITLQGDALASKPLLHKVLIARKEINRPISQLFLDYHFKSNMESWNWINERAEVTEISQVGTFF